GSALTMKPPAGATVVDLGDRTILPGLIDMHTHLIGDASLGGYNS
ncbi:MAG TPA: Xaa-Pro dipeptidase, partial [Parvularcula sp.]|nr:Xaa-Pro dipeptidase [Parvularcula sp.]